MKRVAKDVAAKAAVDGFAVHGSDPFDRRQIRPGLDEVAEHNAGVPGIIGDQRQGIERAIVGVAIVDDFDRRRHRIDRGGDMHERRHAALRRKIALEPHGDFELKPHSAVGGRA